MGLKCSSKSETGRALDEMYSNYSGSRTGEENEQQCAEAVFSASGQAIAWNVSRKVKK